MSGRQRKTSVVLDSTLHRLNSARSARNVMDAPVETTPVVVEGDATASTMHRRCTF